MAENVERPVVEQEVSQRRFRAGLLQVTKGFVYIFPGPGIC
jgi:hypothetical protein